MADHLTRRQFFRQAAAYGSAAAAVGTVAPQVLASPLSADDKLSANDKLNVGIIGSGGRGWANMRAVGETENIVALCDVDANSLGRAAEQYPDARKYTDFRKLLDEGKDLDAVIVSTPDHCHAAASVMAMNLGKHVYCEKPLTRTVYEARVMTETVARQKVVTQMGTGAQSDGSSIRTVEAIRAGAIGKVRAVHCWTDRPVGWWPNGQDRPEGEDPVPAHVHWNEWIGPAPMRPYKAKYAGGPFQGKQVYHPFVWRGWWDFGTGSLGDIAPHIMNVAFWALNLGAPTSVVAECSGMKPEAFPTWSIVTYEFPARADRPPVKLVWYDGKKKPAADVVEGENLPPSGTLFVGEKGTLIVGGPILPRQEFADYQYPEPTLPRRIEIHKDWVRAIKENDQTGCHFGYSGPMTEAYLLGNIALKMGRKIEWDPVKFEVTNCPEANQHLRSQYREGWTL